jgi:hypothetical protein
MSSIDNLDGRVDQVEKQVEYLVRGGTGRRAGQLDSPTLLKTVKQVFDLATTNEIKEAARCLDEAGKMARVNVAVRLHNKARNLAPGVNQGKYVNNILYVCNPLDFDLSATDLKSLVRALAAWLIFLFTEATPKALCTLLKLLSRAVNEVQDNFLDVALQCCGAAIELWEQVDLLVISQSLATLEFQDAQMSIFQAYLMQGSILRMTSKNAKLSSEVLSTIRKSITAALNLVQSLPNGLKMYFAEAVMTIAAAFANSPTPDNEEAITYFHLAIRCLESIRLAKSFAGKGSMPAEAITIAGTESSQDDPLGLDEKDLRKMKIKAQLSLAYVFKEIQ